MRSSRLATIAVLIGLHAALDYGVTPAATGRQADAPVAADPLDLHITVLTPRAIGSAFLLEPGVIVTAGHLVAGMAPGMAVRLRRGDPGGPTAEARLLARSGALDLAVLHAPAGFAAPMATGEAEAAGLLHAAGAVPVADPAVLARPLRVSGAATGASMRIAGVGPGVIARLAGVVPGFSGGPVLDARGRLVGMIVAIRSVPAAGSAFTPRQAPPARGVEEALILPAPAIRAEARRLIGR